MRAKSRDVVVVGAGISGLTCAWHLRRAGRDVLLLDAHDAVGGAIQTERRAGFLLEKGPYNVIVRDPAFEELLEGLGDRVNVVTASEQAKNRYIYRHGRLHAVPTGPVGFLRSPLISFPGRLRAMRGLLVSKRGWQQETTLHEFATRRFGAEVADSIVSAAIAGILAGDTRRLSAYACFPVLRDFDTRSFSPLGRTARRIPAMIRKRRNPQLDRRWKGLVSIDCGLGGLCEAVAEPLGDDVWMKTRVERITTTRPDGGYALQVTNAGGEAQTLHCRQLVLATPARVTSDLLMPHCQEAADELRGIDSASLTVVNLAFRREDVAHPLDGFGFLVPHNEPDFPLMGTLFADSAFPHHAPSNQRLLRVFFGGARMPDVDGRAPDQLVQTACRALRDVLGVRGEPTLVDVCPYPNAIPQYYLDHLERIARFREQVRALPNLHFVGNYLEGVSINDCVKLAKRVAHEVPAVAAEEMSAPTDCQERKEGVCHAVSV